MNNKLISLFIGTEKVNLALRHESLKIKKLLEFPTLALYRHEFNSTLPAEIISTCLLATRLHDAQMRSKYGGDKIWRISTSLRWWIQNHGHLVNNFIIETVVLLLETRENK
jgi:hypothetical protein